MASTPEQALSEWLTGQAAFIDAFPGGLHYDVAPAGEGLEYPFVSFARTGATPTMPAGKSSWSEDITYTFDVWDTGDAGDGAEIAESARTLESILFGTRGAYQTPIHFTDGRILRRRGSLAGIGLAAGLGRGGADVQRATIEATLLVARDS